MSEKQNDLLTRYEANSAEKAYKKHKAEAEEGEKTNTEILIGVQRRLFFLLQDTFDEIAAAGSYIHRKSPSLAEKYIPFRTAYLRERPPSSKKTE